MKSVEGANWPDEHVGVRQLTRSGMWHVIDQALDSGVVLRSFHYSEHDRHA